MTRNLKMRPSETTTILDSQNVQLNDEIRKAALELYIEHKSNHLAYVGVIAKAIGLPVDVDPTHEYSHRSGEYGDYRYYWADRAGNYWVYTNAPEDHLHHDERRGEPFIDPKQPMPHTAPEYFTSDGRKRHRAVPGTALPQQNPAYSPDDPQNVWFESFQDGESAEVQYVYLDSDIKNDPALYVAYNARVVDSNVGPFRKAVAKMFAEPGSKSRVIGTLLALMDQAYFTVDELIDASVGDLQFVGTTVKLLGRKLVCDEDLYKFLVSLKAQRADSAPLFMINSNKGVSKIGRHHLSAILEHLRMSPAFLQLWHATQMYVKIFSRLMAEGQLTTPEEVDQRAIYETGLAMGTDQDVTYLILPQVRVQLLMNYMSPDEVTEAFTADPDEPTDTQMGLEAEANAASDNGEPPPGSEEAEEAEGPPVKKSITASDSDSMGTAQVSVTLDDYTETERQFSDWLHQQPLHMLGVLPEAAWWEDAEVPDGLEMESPQNEAPVEQAPKDEETKKGLSPVRITIVRAASSSDTVVHGWSTELISSGSMEGLSKALASEAFDSVYTSDLPRALPTALAVQAGQATKPKIYRSNSLRTYNFGALTGQSMGLAKSLVAQWPNESVQPLHGESYHTFHDRIVGKFNEIVKSASPGSSVCLVMHGLPALLVQSYVLSSQGFGHTATLMKGLNHDPGAFSQLLYFPDTAEYRIVTLNSKAHA